MQKSCSDGWMMSLRYVKVATVYHYTDIGTTRAIFANSTSSVVRSRSVGRAESKVSVSTSTLPRLLLLLKLKLVSSDD